MNLPNKRLKNKKRKGNDPRLTQLIHNQIVKENRKTRMMKYIDFLVLSTPTPSLPSRDKISTIPQGVAQNDRVADTVFIDRIEIRTHIKNYSSDIATTIRYNIFVYKENDTAIAFNTNTVYQSSTLYGTITPFNFENRKLYTVKFDRLINLVGLSTSLTNNTQHTFMTQIKMNNHRIDFEQGVTTGTGNIFLTTITDAGVNTNLQIATCVRLHYYDE